VIGTGGRKRTAVQQEMVRAQSLWQKGQAGECVKLHKYAKLCEKRKGDRSREKKKTDTLRSGVAVERGWWGEPEAKLVE